MAFVAMRGLVMEAYVSLEPSVLVLVGAITKNRLDSSASNSSGLQRFHGLGYSSPAHRMDAMHGLGLTNIWSEMAQLFGFVSRCYGGLDRGSLGFFTGRFLVEFYSSVDFVYRFAVISIFTRSVERTTLDEHMHGSCEPAVFSPSVINRFCR